MKKYIYLAAFLGGTMALTSSSSTVTYPSVTNESFKQGEKLTYRVTYGVVDAGEAVIEVKSTTKTGAGRPLHHVVGTGKTLGGFNTFYKVHDVYESYIDQKSIMPWFFDRDVNEGGYEIKQNYSFKQRFFLHSKYQYSCMTYIRFHWY